MVGADTVGDSLETWASSGRIYPNLLPDEASTETIRKLQATVTEQVGGVVESKPHLTLFYAGSPHELVDELQAEVPNLNRTHLHTDLAQMIAALTFRFSHTFNVSGLDLFGADKDVLVMMLDESGELGYYREEARQMLIYILRLHGMTIAIERRLAQHECYRWVLDGGSVPHVTLARRVQILPELSLPASLTFASSSPGSIKQLRGPYW